MPAPFNHAAATQGPAAAAFLSATALPPRRPPGFAAALPLRPPTSVAAHLPVLPSSPYPNLPDRPTEANLSLLLFHDVHADVTEVILPGRPKAVLEVIVAPELIVRPIPRLPASVR